MSTRKYQSGYEKLKKKRNIEELIQSQKAALDRFVKINPKNKTGNIAKDLVTEEQINLIEPENLDQTQYKNDNENIYNYNKMCNTPPINI